MGFPYQNLQAYDSDPNNPLGTMERDVEDRSKDKVIDHMRALAKAPKLHKIPDTSTTSSKPTSSTQTPRLVS